MKRYLSWGLAALSLFGGGYLVGQSGLNINEYSKTSTFAVTNGSATSIYNYLADANFIQLSLDETNAQIYTYCKPAGDCIEVGSGFSFELGPYGGGAKFGAGQLLGTVQTATGGATLQVESQKRIQ